MVHKTICQKPNFYSKLARLTGMALLRWWCGRYLNLYHRLNILSNIDWSLYVEISVWWAMTMNEVKVTTNTFPGAS